MTTVERETVRQMIPLQGRIVKATKIRPGIYDIHGPLYIIWNGIARRSDSGKLFFLCWHRRSNPLWKRPTNGIDLAAYHLELVE